MTGCSVSGCTNAIHARGYCSTHYWRNAKYGEPTFSKVRLIEFNGKSDTLTGWAGSIGIDPASLKGRMASWPLALALTVPKNGKLKRCAICDEPFNAVRNSKTCSPEHARENSARAHVQWRASNKWREKIYKARYLEGVRQSSRRISKLAPLIAAQKVSRQQRAQHEVV
jgi:hypothetical protein